MAQTVEILSYKLHSGASAAFHDNMTKSKLPLHGNVGIDVVAFGQSMQYPDSYVFIRSFSSAEQMSRLLKDFYESRAWTKGPRDGMAECISDTHRVVCRVNNASVKLLRGIKLRA